MKAPCVSFELLFNKCLFIFRLHAGVFWDMLLVVLHRDDGRIAVLLSLSYDMH